MDAANLGQTSRSCPEIGRPLGKDEDSSPGASVGSEPGFLRVRRGRIVEGWEREQSAHQEWARLREGTN
jgi:hypothetical protein